MPLIVLRLKSVKRRLILAATLVAMLTAPPAFAQSIEPNSPTPVLSNEINGRIAPLDIGDARLTRFFYTFNGLQGDLELTVESNNLDGDIDIYLAGNLRPLTKVTLYAGTSATRLAKSVYLRRDEPLILRVQARTPNDAEGTYRITFGGAFRPAERLAGNDAAASPVEPTPASPTPTPARSADKKIRRVTSAGARIEEPVVEVAVKEEAEKSAKTPAAPPAAAPKKAPPKPRPARDRRGTRGDTRAQTGRGSSPETSSDGATKSETPKPEDAGTETGEAAAKTAKAKPERARPVRVPRARNNRDTARRTGAPPAEVVPAAPAEIPAPPAPSPRLVLVMRDGETLERDMSSVRRVTVEKGMIVIVSNNGKTERQPMAAVLRMSIEP